MSGESIIFNNKKIKKSKFYKNKKLFKIDDIDVNKISVSKKEPYGKKVHLNTSLDNDDDVIRLLCIKLPQMIDYVKHFDSNKTMYFKFTDKNC